MMFPFLCFYVMLNLSHQLQFQLSLQIIFSRVLTSSITLPPSGKTASKFFNVVRIMTETALINYITQLSRMIICAN